MLIRVLKYDAGENYWLLTILIRCEVSLANMSNKVQSSRRPCARPRVVLEFIGTSGCVLRLIIMVMYNSVGNVRDFPIEAVQKPFRELKGLKACGTEVQGQRTQGCMEGLDDLIAPTTQGDSLQDQMLGCSAPVVTDMPLVKRKFWRRVQMLNNLPQAWENLIINCSLNSA